MSVLDYKIEYILNKENYIKNKLLTAAAIRQDTYGKNNSKVDIEVSKLIFLLKNKFMYGNNTKLAIYKKLLDYLRKMGIIFKVPEAAPSVVRENIFYGQELPNLIESEITSKLIRLSSDREDLTLIFNTTGAEVYYFAYPQSWGILSRIYDTNGFNTIGGYLTRSVQLSIDSNIVNYYLMEFSVVSSVSNFNITFTF